METEVCPICYQTTKEEIILKYNKMIETIHKNAFKNAFETAYEKGKLAGFYEGYEACEKANNITYSMEE